MAENMSKFKRAALEAVVSQLVAMYENNVLGENLKSDERYKEL